MKPKFYFIPLLCLAFSCTSSYDKLVLDNANLDTYQSLEQNLASKKLYRVKNEKLPKAFLPIDTNLKFTNVAAYERSTFVNLPMSSRAYTDSIGNEILIYEWDKVTLNMSEKEKDKIKHAFDKYHTEYVNKYNELTNQLTEALGAPLTADKKLQPSEMEVFKFWKSSQSWQKDNIRVELNLVMMPTELYRVIVKILILKQ
jgi:hypothetical protein